MKQNDMEKRFQTAVEHAAPDVLEQVLDGCAQPSDNAAVIPLPRRRRRLPIAIPVSYTHLKLSGSGCRCVSGLRPFAGVSVCGEMEIVGGFEGNDGIVISGGKMTFHTPDGLVLEEYISPTHAFFTLGTVEITGGVLDIYLGKYDTGFYVANYTGTGHDKADIAISGGSISVEGGDQALMVQYVPEKSGDKPAVEITGGSFTADTGSYAIRSYYGGDVVIRRCV